MASPVPLFSDEHRAKVTNALVSGDLARTTAKIFHECDANKTTFLELSHGEIRLFVVEVFAILGLDSPTEALIYDVYKRFDVSNRGSLDFEECLQLVVLLSNVVLGIQKPLKGMVQADPSGRGSFPPRRSSGNYPPSRSGRRSLSPTGSTYRTASPRTLGNPTGAPLEDRRHMGSYVRTASPRTLGNPTGAPPPRAASPPGSLRMASPGRVMQSGFQPPSSRESLRRANKPSSSVSSVGGDSYSLDVPPLTPASTSSVKASASTSSVPTAGSTPRGTPGSSLTGRVNSVGEWAVDNIIQLENYPRGPFACKVKILPRRLANSIPAAVDALNSGNIECTEDFCVAFSEVVNSHFLLYKRGKEAEAWDGLEIPQPPMSARPTT